MAITVNDIEALTFNEAKRGYDPVEVNIALDNIALEVKAFIETIAALEGELNSAKAELAKALKNSASKSSKASASSDGLSADEEAISRAFVAAQRSADELKRTAASQADDIIAEANTKAEQIVSEASGKAAQIESDLALLNEKRIEFQKEFLNLLETYRKVASQNSQLDKAVAKQAGAKAADAADEAVEAAVASQGSAILAESQSISNTASLEQIEDDEF